MALSLSLARGQTGSKISDFTTGVLTPGAGDFEFRYNTVDTNAAAIPRKDVINALKAFEQALESGNLIQTPAGI
jgi:hypothetical protein